MKQVINTISQYGALSEKLKDELRVRLTFQSFKKKDVLLHSSGICKDIYFIQKGILRLYYIRNGKEISEFFCSENQWMNSPRSFMKQETDDYFIDAIEDCEVWSISRDDLVYLFNNHNEMERYSRLDMCDTLLLTLDRLSNLRFTSAKEKYHHFLQTYQKIYYRIPLGMVASYVGITQETLSRLRKDTF